MFRKRKLLRLNLEKKKEQEERSCLKVFYGPSLEEHICFSSSACDGAEGRIVVEGVKLCSSTQRHLIAVAVDFLTV